MTDGTEPETEMPVRLPSDGSARPVPAVTANGIGAIAAVIGVEAAERLIERFPGAWYYLAVEHWDGPLPSLLADIDRLIGRELTLRFARAFGGQRIYIPKLGGRRDNVVSRVIGVEAAENIARNLIGGENVTIPLGPMNFVAMRTQRVRSLLIAGFTTPRIAQICGVTERSVWNNKRLLVEFGVIPSSGSLPEGASSRIAQAKAMLLDEKRPDDIARHLGLAETEVMEQLRELRDRGAVIPPTSYEKGL